MFFPKKNAVMRHPKIFLVLVVIGCILLAGCTQSSKTLPATTAVPQTTVTGSESGTLVPPVAATSVPRQVVTVIHYVSQIREIKDSELLFALQVPVEWNVSTCQLMRSDYPDYRTDLVADNVFSIYSYGITNNQDRAYRDEFRQWSPAPTETTVTINDITYDRFESTADGKTTVSYIVHKSSANERGYASVLVFTARDSNRFEKEDFEKVVSSFRYYGRDDISTMPGEEIPLYDLSGNVVSHKGVGGGSLAWGQWEGDSSEGGSTGGDSSGESSSDGCGCGG
jgi:hypothetical protein